MHSSSVKGGGGATISCLCFLAWKSAAALASASFSACTLARAASASLCAFV